MKKMIAFALCLSILFTLTVSANSYAAKVTCNSGEGQGTSFYATASMGGKTGYYAYLTCSLTGTYKPDENTKSYTKSYTAKGGGPDNEGYSITARVIARASNHIRVSHKVDYSGEHRPN